VYSVWLLFPMLSQGHTGRHVMNVSACVLAFKTVCVGCVRHLQLRM